MEHAENDNSLRRAFFSDVLRDLTSALASTKQKSSFIRPPSTDEADQIVGGFTEYELSMWQDGLQKGLSDKDWADLIAHRTYCLTSDALKPTDD
jgi:hypothetical protein